MIFDLHNDLVTARKSAARRQAELLSTPHEAIYACWTTEWKNATENISQAASFLRHRRIAIEDAGFTAREGVSVFDRYPFAYVGLTHNGDNALAGGAAGVGRLSPRGKELIRMLNAKHIPIDLAHLNAQSYYDVLACAERVLDSHTGWTEIHAHPRNIDDAQIEALFRRGGILGFTAVRDFLGADDVHVYARGIDRLVQRFGIDGIAIGSDFHGTKPLIGLRTYDDFDGVSKDLSSFGYDEHDIAAIFYENAASYFAAL